MEGKEIFCSRRRVVTLHLAGGGKAVAAAARLRPERDMGSYLKESASVPGAKKKKGGGEKEFTKKKKSSSPPRAHHGKRLREEGIRALGKRGGVEPSQGNNSLHRKSKRTKSERSSGNPFGLRGKKGKAD